MSRHHFVPLYPLQSETGRISLDLHRYNFEKENNPVGNYCNIPKEINLDELVSNSSDDDFEFDELTTTSGELPRENYFKKKRRYSKKEIPLDQYKSRIGPLTRFHSLSTIYPHQDSSEEEPYLFEVRKQPRALEMIQEISPIPHVNSDVDEDLPPMMPLKMTKEFQPLQTSTTTSFYPHLLPKTNPRHSGVPNTPRSQRLVNLDDQRPTLLDQRRSRMIPKPDHFGLPSQVARRYGSKGILYLSIGVSRQMTLTVSIRNAIFFLDPGHPVSSFVRLEIKRKPTNSRKRSKSSRQRLFEVVKTSTVTRNNSPDFFEVFKFKVSREHCEANDILAISVFAKTSALPVPERELIGCMAFPLKKMFDKIDGLCERRGRSRSSAADKETITVASGGYFLLGKEKGAVSHLSEAKISHRKYYDEIGGTSLSTCSSAISSSPIKMISESDWRQTPASSAIGHSHKKEGILTRLGVSPIKEQFQNHLDFASSSASSCYQSHYAVSIKKRIPGAGAMINGEPDTVMSPSTSSSSNSSTMNAIIGGPNGNEVNCDFSTSNSSSSSGLDFKRSAYKRFTLPSIIATNAQTPVVMSGESKIRRRHFGSVDAGILEELENDSELDDDYTPSDIDKFGKIVATKELRHDAKKIQMKMNYHPSVRRVASFTSPPTKTELAKQQQQQNKEHRRGFFGKTLHFLRNKVDGSMSQSALYPTQDEVRSWQEKMENLLENKYGCILFGEFLDKEYSRENLDFVLKCREYKKLFLNPKKNQKKIQKLAKEIFDNFLEDGAPQEVNLESTVKTATKKAFKEELEENTFSLAQNKIEQLMDNDKYRRFLQSSTYSNLLDTVTKGSQLSIQSANPDVQYSEDILTTPIAQGNEDTPVAPQLKTLRSASAIENGSIHTITE